LTGCDPQDEFTCRDGSCISQELKCDGKADCEDGDDEQECNTVVVPESYNKNMVPQSTSTNKLSVNVTITIENVLDVNEVGQSMKVEMKIVRTWFDTRLTFQNLNKDVSLNILSTKDLENIWYPVFNFINMDQSQSQTAYQRHYSVIRNYETKPKPVAKTELTNTYNFQGSDNKLRMSSTYTNSWTCIFDLQLYPFDTQRCTIQLKFPDFYEQFVGFKAENMFNNAKELATYKIEKIFFCSHANNTRLIVEITLGRPLISSILTIFVPTILLLIISHVVQVFSEDYLDMVIQVHLTVLLVLASL